jgi:hypothetical protein
MISRCLIIGLSLVSNACKKNTKPISPTQSAPTTCALNVTGAAVTCTALLNNVEGLTVASGIGADIAQRGNKVAIVWTRSDKQTPVTIAYSSSGTSQPKLVSSECSDADGTADSSSKIALVCKIP